MELQHRQSGVMSGKGSALNTPSVGTPLDASSAHRGVLQERSANWPHDNTASPLTGTQAALQKTSRSQSPAENVYTQHTTTTGNYFTGSLHAHHIGLAGHGVERNEVQIEKDIKRLYALLNRSDKYQKYREKQPQLTPQQFIEREAREAKMQVDKDNKSPEKSVWPEFLEHAFWRGEWMLLIFCSPAWKQSRLTHLSTHSMAANGAQEIHARWCSPRPQRTHPGLDLQGHRNQTGPQTGVEPSSGAQAASQRPASG